MKNPNGLSEQTDEEKIIDDLMRYLRYAIIAVGVILSIQSCPAIQQIESNVAAKVRTLILE